VKWPARGLKLRQRRIKTPTSLLFRALAGIALLALAACVVDRIAVRSADSVPVSVDAPLAASEIAAQLEENAQLAHEFVVTTALQRNEGIAHALQRLRISAPALSRHINQDPRARALRALRPGHELHITYDQQRDLKTLVAKIDDPARAHGVRRVALHRDAGGRFATAESFQKHNVYWQVRSGTIERGFFSSMARAGVPGQIVAEAMRLFDGSIDFRKGFRDGDTFRVIYQRTSDDAKPKGVGRILAIELETRGKRHQAVWHGTEGKSGPLAADAPGHHYRFDGSRIGESEWRLPTEMKRISSSFGSRIHPMSGLRRDHDGIDLAAPSGTPVVAAKSGTVSFVGQQRGYGNLVIIRHGGRYSTYYGHLRDFTPGVRVGTLVAQGQRIGSVGQTGYATGPHLHFEVRTNGKPIDPMVVLLSPQPELKGVQMAAFRRTSAPLIAQIERMRAGAALQSTATQSPPMP
jgi:murein DD-endopeptidase MepM/ murein hydrolase activator NlpD